MKAKTHAISYLLILSLILSMSISAAVGEKPHPKSPGKDTGTVSLKVTAPKFFAEITGYKKAPASKPIVIENTGDKKATDVKVKLDNKHFVIAKPSGKASIDAGKTDKSWKIQPAAKLKKGVYTTKVTVTCKHGSPVSANVKFRVADDMIEDVVEYLSEDIGQSVYGTPKELESAEYVADQFRRYKNLKVEVKKIPLLNNADNQDGYMQRSYPTTSGYIEIEGAPSVSGTPNPSNHEAAFSSFDGLFYDFGTYDNRQGATDPAAELKFPDAGDVAAHGGKVYGTVRFEGAPSTAHGTAVVDAIKAACGATDVTGLIMARTASGGSAPGDPQYVTSTINLTSLNISTIGVPLRYLEQVAAAGEKGNILSVRRIVPEETYATIATKPAKTKKPDLVIVLCGHIDSYIPSPGANDNASAIASLVELARTFNDFNTKNVELVFAAVGGEEYSGYNGSAHVAELLLKDGRRDIGINLTMDMIAAQEGAVSAAGAPINTIAMGTYMGTGNTIEPQFNLSSHLVLSHMKEDNLWKASRLGLDKAHLISYDASDHEMFGYFGMDSARMVVGGDIPYTGGSRFSAMEQLYHTSQDTMTENWSYERNLLAANIMKNAVKKAIELDLTKRAKFSIKGKSLHLDNAAQHFKSFKKIEVELIHKKDNTRKIVVFNKKTKSVTIPNIKDYRINYEAVATGEGIADHTNAEMNKRYKTFTTKLHSEGKAGLILPRPDGPLLQLTAPTFDPVDVGYARPAAKSIAIENIGDAEARITSMAATNGWTIGATNANNPQQRVVSGGVQLRRTIRPPAGLAEGLHTSTVTITYDNGKIVTTQVSMRVGDVQP